MESISEEGTAMVFGLLPTFWLLNSRIPSDHHFEYVLWPGFSDSYCNITESQFLATILCPVKDDRDLTNQQEALKRKLLTVFSP